MRRILLAAWWVGVGCAPRETTSEPVVLPPAAPLVTATTTATVAPTARVEPAPPPGPVANGLAVPGRDPRPGPRDAKLVATELRNLELLARSTPANDPNAPNLQRRIAEAHVELRKAGVEGSAPAIAAYEKLLSSWPGAPKQDEILYDLGLEYEIGNDLMRARKALYELIKTAPTSPWVPYAYFAFGEQFAREGDSSKYPLAQQAFLEAMKYPSPIQPDAMWRLAQVEDAQGNTTKAQALYAKLRALHPASDAVKRIGEPL
jgi:TolA-binding protein